MAVTNNFKSISLKQHGFIIYSSEGQKFEMGLTGLKPGVGRAEFSVETPGKNLFSHLF